MPSAVQMTLFSIFVACQTPPVLQSDVPTEDISITRGFNRGVTVPSHWDERNSSTPKKLEPRVTKHTSAQHNICQKKILFYTPRIENVEYTTKHVHIQNAIRTKHLPDSKLVAQTTNRFSLNSRRCKYRSNLCYLLCVLRSNQLLELG